MESNIITVDEALNLIKAGNFNTKYKINSTDKKIDTFNAILLGKNGIEVPEELIEYDDDKINYSDIPPIKAKDISSGKVEWVHKAEIPIRKEVEDWLKEEKIDINILLTDATH